MRAREPCVKLPVGYGESDHLPPLYPVYVLFIGLIKLLNHLLSYAVCPGLSAEITLLLLPVR